MDSSSSFSNTPDLFSQAEKLNTSGATSDCYRVRLYGRLHFLKRLKEELRTDPRYVTAMQKEFEVGYNLDHPHIIKYISKGDDYILMEYVDGEPLSDFMKSHPDLFANKVYVNRLLGQLLAAVDCLHQHGIVHLDLKPQNILITRIGHNVKLADLGFCYTDAYPNTMGRTERYAAPEQFDKRLLPDERTDIYAIGRIIEQFPCANKYNKVIARCTATQPSQRYQSVQKLLTAIQPKTFNWRPIAVGCFVVALLSAFYLLWPRTSAPVLDPQPSDTIMSSVTTSVTESKENDKEEIRSGEQSDSQSASPSESQSKTPSDEHSQQQMTAAVSAPTPSVTRQEPSTSPAASVSKMSVTALRQKLRSVMQPIYASTLEPLTRKTYSGNEQLYNSEAESFRSQLRSRLHPLGEELAKTGAVEQRTFYQEWSKMEMDYINKAYEQMVRNQEQLSSDIQKP